MDNKDQRAAAAKWRPKSAKAPEAVAEVLAPVSTADMTAPAAPNSSGGRTRKADARTFGQDLMRGEYTVGKATGAIAGAKVGSGKNAFMFKTAEGYKSGTDINKQTASLEGGTTFGLTAHPYDASSDTEATPAQSGTSIFDPVLCELSYRWFSPKGGVVLDPFAGGSVRGIVASKMGRQYVGVDLNARQIAANEKQADDLCAEGEVRPVWLVGDSRNVVEMVGDVRADFVFSCPPYADLERYSDDPNDLSVLGYDEFLVAYNEIVIAVCSLLKPNRFASFVVGDVRDKNGMYYGFPWHTIAAFENAGLRLYNEAVLVTAVGSLPVRATRQFDAARKLGKTHQNCFVFVKGDPKKATQAIIESERAAV